MDTAPPPALHALAEQRGLRRDTVISAPAVPHQPLADVIGHGHDEIAGLGAGDRSANLGGKCWGRPLVRVHLEDPVARARFDAGVAATGLERPVALDPARPASTR